MKARSARGFTLLELLIALSLIGLMVSLLFAALRFSGRAWDSSEARLEHSTAMSMVWRYLDARFRQARLLRHQVEDERRPHFFFQGNAQAVEFVAPMPAHLGSGGLYIIRIWQQGHGENGRLMLTRWLYHPEVLEGKANLPRWRPLSGQPRENSNAGADVRAWYSQSVLLEKVERLKLSYFGLPDPKAEAAIWTESWEDRKILPMLVRMEIEDTQGPWPEMIFALPGY